MIIGKTIEEWKEDYPLLEKIADKEEVFWINPDKRRIKEAEEEISLDIEDIEEAEERLKRFAPFIAEKFPETAEDSGIIESGLEEINLFKDYMIKTFGVDLKGDLFLKCDHKLPIAGSIKARGGIYEVLKYAEDLAKEQDLLFEDDNYVVLADDRFKDFFSQYSLAVGSTGNLGLSIGITGVALGFKTTVHMSDDAREWKKSLLRSHGVIVKEYQSDYSQAVKEGRRESEDDPRSYFVDDEKSETLFLGYAVAALRLKKQLDKKGIFVNSNSPLFVYLPCGVGGSPGGICFGLRLVFGDDVHCFFAEPTHSPAVLLGMLTGLHDKISVQDFGIDNITAADGLAVGTPSAFVGRLMEPLLDGIYTAEDDLLFVLLKALKDVEGFELEPSALAGFPGVVKLFQDENAINYLDKNSLSKKMEDSSHIVWATGGSMVPSETKKEYYVKGRELGRKI